MNISKRLILLLTISTASIISAAPPSKIPVEIDVPQPTAIPVEPAPPALAPQNNDTVKPSLSGVVKPSFGEIISANELTELSLTVGSRIKIPGRVETKPSEAEKLKSAFILTPYRPVDPIVAGGYTSYKAGQFSDEDWPTSSGDICKLLPNYSSFVVTIKDYGEANAKFVTGSLSAKAGRYKVIMDFIKYRVEPLTDSKGEYICLARVGVGLRIVTELVTMDGNVDLGSLFAIGASAKAGKLRGSMSVEVIGVSSPDVTNLIPMTSIVDDTSIQAALQALSAIKSKIHDDATILVPHVVACALKEPAETAPTEPASGTESEQGPVKPIKKKQ